MHKIVARLGMTFGLTFFWVDPSFALDSYRFLHVTIETPWTIFIFLLLMIFVPFLLMAVLVWRYAERKVDPEKTRSIQAKGE
jgi:sensor histidine kinase YesM